MAANYRKSHFDPNKTNDISTAVIFSNTIKVDCFPRYFQFMKKIKLGQSCDQI